jgi:hypothetical protein
MYTATLSRSQGRNSFSMIYRHPIRKSPDGKSGLRCRKGLGTSDEEEANRLINQMNRLLQDKEFWNITVREKASSLFDERIVQAFYDDMLPAERDSWGIRENFYPLPGINENYVRAYLLGTTGAGKTTLVRQLIGTSPTKERFPATSTARTTVADLEVITTDGPLFSSIITFLTREQTYQNIDECVFQALLTKVRDMETSSGFIAERLLSHVRFRLRYILGDERVDESSLWGKDIFDDEALEEEETDLEISNEDRQKNADFILHIVKKIENIAGNFRKSIEKMLLDSSSNSEDEEAFQEILEEELEHNVRDADTYHSLIDEIADAVELRFAMLTKGKLELDSSKWPSHWTFSIDDRGEFIKTVKRFTSNTASLFGTLLTPLVDGIRVSGPFRPEWAPEENPRLVLLDSEGMGHTSDSVTSVPPRISRRYDKVDVVLLVDNAKQPLQAAPVSILKSLSSSGYDEKLILCFTHFDEVKGPNIGTIDAKKAHVLASLDNVLKSIGESSHRSAENNLRKVAKTNVVFLAKLDKKLSSAEMPNTPIIDFAIEELRQLIFLLNSKRGKVPEPLEVFPIYDDAALALFIQQAIQEFHQHWQARLGLSSYPGIGAEHWALIKALSRRIVNGDDGYHSLQPLADMIGGLTNHISRFLANPIEWNQVGSNEKQELAIQRVKQKTHRLLHDFAKKRLIDDQKQKWHDAYWLRGRGSTYVRANAIDAIHRTAAPPIQDALSSDEQKFLRDVRDTVREGIAEAEKEILGQSK